MRRSGGMPQVKLPTSGRGWLVVLASSMVGFIAGTLALAWLGKVFR